MTKYDLIKKLEAYVTILKRQRKEESCKGTRQAYLDGMIHAHKQTINSLKTDNWEEEPAHG